MILWQRARYRKLFLFNLNLRSVLFLDFSSTSSLLPYLVSIATEIQLGAGSENFLNVKKFSVNLEREDTRQHLHSFSRLILTLFPGILYFFLKKLDIYFFSHSPRKDCHALFSNLITVKLID